MDWKDNLAASPLKRNRIDQDPDYGEAAPPDLKRLKCLEDNARSELADKVGKILTKQLGIEVERQKSEIAEIERSIFRVQQNLQLLRYVSARSYYSSKNLQLTGASSSQPVIHPAVKNLLGKRPKEEDKCSDAPERSTSECLKVPRYIPPKLPEKFHIPATLRGERYNVKKRLVIGNVSKWIPVSERDDSASHKWMVYVRGSKDEPDISLFVSRVAFFLHPSYAPHDVVEVNSHPFHITRRGWGEFPLRVQVFFRNPLSKPVNIIHHLKLDRSYTGLQTLGSETVVDVGVSGNLSASATSLLQTCEGKHPNRIEDEACASVDPNLIKTEVMDYINQEISSLEASPRPEGLINIYNGASTFLMDTSAIKTEKSDSPPLSDDADTVDINVAANTTIKAEADDEPTISADQPVIPTSISSEQQTIVKQETNTVDHDYFRLNPTLPVATSAVCGASASVRPLQLNPALLKLANLKFNGMKPLVLSGSPIASGSNATCTAGTAKPVLVRCLDATGTVINFPLSLFRKAVVMKPYHLVKPGESLLCPPLIKARQELQQQQAQQASGKPAVRIVLPTVSSIIATTKTDAGPKKDAAESKYLTERRSLEQMLAHIQSGRWLCNRDCVRALAPLLSIVDIRATDSVFRSVRPFACSSLAVFESWNLGKQRSAEWNRAKLIAQTVSGCRILDGGSKWSTKRVMIWCRRQGYSPLACWSAAPAVAPTALETVVLPDTLSEVQMPCTDAVVVEEDGANEFVDVESSMDGVRKPDESRLKERCGDRRKVVLHGLEELEIDVQLADMLVASVDRLGFKLGEELVEGTLHAPLARFLILNVWKRLADDLIRRSLRQSWQRCRGRIPESVSLMDVRQAVVRREEFDILTDKGLGMYRSYDAN